MPYIVSCGFFCCCFFGFFFNLRRLASKLLNHISTIDLVIFQNLNHGWAPWISSCEATRGLNNLATMEYSLAVLYSQSRCWMVQPQHTAY